MQTLKSLIFFNEDCRTVLIHCYQIYVKIPSFLDGSTACTRSMYIYMGVGIWYCISNSLPSAKNCNTTKVTMKTIIIKFFQIYFWTKYKFFYVKKWKKKKKLLLFDFFEFPEFISLFSMFFFCLLCLENSLLIFFSFDCELMVKLYKNTWLLR